MQHCTLGNILDNHLYFFSYIVDYYIYKDLKEAKS